jgi:two-component system sensor histidine kinase RstB
LLKILLQLVAIVFTTAILGQQLILPLLSDSLFVKQQEWGMRFLTQGTINLAVEQLENSSGNIVDEVNALQAQFGYKLVLLPFHSFDEKQQQQLKKGMLVTDTSTLSIYKQIKKHQLVFGFENYEMASSNVTSQAQAHIMGTMNMLLNELRDTPELRWEEQIETLSNSFGFTIDVITLDEVELSELEQNYYLNNRIFWRESSVSKEIEFPLEDAYIRIFSSNKLLHVGPISVPIAEKLAPIYLIYYLILSLIILIPLGIWIIPTWISLRRLSKASNEIGKGDFSQRATVIKGSNINRYVRTFNKMASKIEELINVNKSLVNAVSHELRTPLSRIEFDLELARDSNNEIERKKHHDKIETSVDELKVLVNEMLTYAKFDREKPSLNIEQVDLNLWLHNELNSWQVVNSEIKLTLVSSSVEQLSSLDRYYMSRVVSNITRNAVKYAKSKVSISCDVSIENNRIVIEDDGTGIQEQDRERVFDAFIRLDKSRNRDSGGTGLGLAIVKQIIKWHGGNVSISESTLGGAKFVIQWCNIKKSKENYESQ